MYKYKGLYNSDGFRESSEDEENFRDLSYEYEKMKNLCAELEDKCAELEDKCAKLTISNRGYLKLISDMHGK